jgi:NADPH:quinone reductase-like Zn-dependent oxidoreductase
MPTNPSRLGAHASGELAAAHALPTMKAVVRRAYGSADVLSVKEIERPTIADDEVLVRVDAAGLDRGAVHIMTGQPYLMRIAGFGLRRPKRAGLGSELAGVVEAIGAAVTAHSVGDRVYGSGQSSFAEYAVAKPGMLARMPANLTFEQAAAVPISGVTALQALRDHGRVQAGQRVLVIGASGGVGSLAVQLAKAFGAQVTGVCSTAKVEFVRSLGADQVIDYTAVDLADVSERYDLVLDIGGNNSVRTLRRLLTPKGSFVFVGGEGGGRLTGGLGRQLWSMALSPFVGQRLGTSWIAKVNSADLHTLRGMVESGTVTPAVDRVCSLTGVADAVRDLAAGNVRGKVVVATS